MLLQIVKLFHIMCFFTLHKKCLCWEYLILGFWGVLGLGNEVEVFLAIFTSLLGARVDSVVDCEYVGDLCIF